jgi:hypothetical protein
VFGSNTIVGTYALSTDYSVAVVLMSAGELYFIKGGAFTNWTLFGLDRTQAGTPYYATVRGAGTTSVAVSAFMRVLQLPPPFTDNYGLATQRLAGARAAGDTFSLQADFMLEWTQTARPSSGLTEVRFRIQDTSNYWFFTVDASGNLTLNRMVAGTPAQVASSAGTIGAGEACKVIAVGQTIDIYDSGPRRINYTSASQFVTATGGKVESLGTSGAVSDVVAWPRTLSGAAAALLDEAIA